MVTARLSPVLDPQGDVRERLLAVRLAGAPFGPPFDLRSSAFEAFLEARREIGRQAAILREELLEALFRQVPLEADRDRRRRLLEIRRRIFANRPLKDIASLGAPPEITEPLERYLALLRREEELAAEEKPVVLEQIRQGLRTAWADPRFRLACRAASPDLTADVENKGLPAAGELSSVERGLYSFLSRFTSKANPFHLFAEVAFAGTSQITADGDHEVVLEAADLLALERRLVALATDPERIHLAPRPFQTVAETLVFWVPTSPGFRLVSRPAGDPGVRQTLAFFAHRRQLGGRPVGSLAQWRAFLEGLLTEGERKNAEETLTELVEQGAVVQYLIEDLDRFAAALEGLDPLLDASLEHRQSLHLARLSLAELEAAAQKPETGRHYVNRFRSLDMTPFESAAEELFADLRELKPFFAERHTFDRHDYVLRSYLLDYLAHRRRDRVPYLEVLRHFLRTYREVIPRYQPEIHRAGAEQRRHEERASRLARLAGRLGPADLAALAPAASADGSPHLCFNGPFDFVGRTFYVSNAFAGGGRFVGRYLLHRKIQAAVPETTGALHAELAVPQEPNLNYVVRRYPVGCGFDARQSNRYERWIDPAEVLVERQGNGIVYRDSLSGRRLHLHYSGFQLAHLLPTEYQLLLVGHADSYCNPFETASPEAHDTGLFYGGICLRRESWTRSREAWEELLAERDLLRFAAALRDRVHGELQPDDFWYYHRNSSRAGRGKPRFLDLQNPLSTVQFQRELSAAVDGTSITLSAMAPPPDHLYRRADGPVVTELMIEV